MNLYQVVSEELYATIAVTDYGEGPSEPYRIVEIVAAETRGQAKWSAWESDEYSFEGTIRDIPKFNIKLLQKGVDESRGIVTDKYEHLFKL